MVKDLRPIYTAIDQDHALAALDAFEAKWGRQLPPVVKAWRDAWEHVIPFLAFPPLQRRAPMDPDPRGWTKALLAFKIHFGDRLAD